MSALPGTTGRRRIYLMRHGHVDYFANHVAKKGTHEAALTRLGRAQADAAGEALASVAFDVTLSSGYPRTRDTLDRVIAHNAHAVPAHDIDEDLVEVRGGAIQGVSGRRAMAHAMAFEYDAAGKPGATLFAGGEVFAEAIARAERGIRRLLARPGWHTALVVAHEGINRLILGWMTGNGLAAVATFEQDLACINVLDFDLVSAATGQGTEIQRRIIKAVNLTPYNYLKHGMNLTSLEFIFEPYEERPDEDG
jgi:probable phosphoglycerate mutase